MKQTGSHKFDPFRTMRREWWWRWWFIRFRPFHFNSSGCNCFFLVWNNKKSVFFTNEQREKEKERPVHDEQIEEKKKQDQKRSTEKQSLIFNNQHHQMGLGLVKAWHTWEIGSIVCGRRQSTITEDKIHNQWRIIGPDLDLNRSKFSRFVSHHTRFTLVRHWHTHTIFLFEEPFFSSHSAVVM